MKKIYFFALRALTAFDWPLLILLCLMAALGLTVMHSAVGSTGGRFADQTHHFLLAFLVMWTAALISPKGWKVLAPLVYVVAVTLLLGVEFFGATSKGATRWLDVGFTRIQPSEMSKIAVPLMVAWFFDRNQTGSLRLFDFLGAAFLLLVPFLLIVKQPDLGTALLVFAAGFCVIYFAGLSFKLLAPVVLMLLVVIGGLLYYEDTICQPDFDWVVLRDYQKHRVCTLLNPSSDPLGKGFHTIQSMIAIGSGGVYGKGYMAGTQSHLDFIPERTTDFVFAVFAEEFGLYGGVMLLVLYGLMIARGLSITVAAHTQFERLLAGSMSMMLFVYVFVNIGMVTGILPVVGVPLPFLSYGGTALMTLGVACGILMSVSRSKGPPKQI
ncbi:rod shape-determining protein RodA [Alcaligenes endophyticus]|uniref:Peptidoglycan glycosyltransferase MrdB n=1 Tax=Alcaligenes endophyticus TaxID=1929088 RepID=A0ABT8ELV9_9BURK|nr:rod shape-determining protein RodA [Alcaligenes endophyticus]MCX5591163.1 rod shape-determining protein RodA [Alcaligenes endophyticus]MDN4122259.1 rod shape-determining protein RodA [Alcaligenes endophyticus]